jgi:hypothetical protein
MIIDQLIERLEEYRDLIGGDAEVRLMSIILNPPTHRRGRKPLFSGT